MSDTSFELDQGAIVRSFVPVTVDGGQRMSFNYTDLTDWGARQHLVSVRIVSHLLTPEESAKMLESVLAVQRPGTTLAQATDGLWRLRNSFEGSDLDEPDAGQSELRSARPAP